MKLLGKWLFFLMFLMFCVSFWQKDYQRLAFEKSHKPYRDLVASFYQKHPKSQQGNFSESFQLRHDLLYYAKKLNHDGWSYHAIQKGYLAQLSPNLSPTDPFWDQLSALIQTCYVNLEHIPYSHFNRKIHQLRYLISTQQIEWVRSHYGKKQLTDAEALAKYLATLEDDDYELYESSRYHNKVASILDANGNHQPVYTDNIPQSNYKILIHFHSEFILSESGQFLVALDPDNLTRNSIVNGSSFNYGNQNDDLHRLLDIDPILLFEPAFIEEATNNPDAPFLVPDLEQQGDKYNPIYSRNGKSSKQLTRAAVKKFKKLLHRYQEARNNEKTSQTQH